MQKNSVCRVADCRRKYGLRRENPARPQPKPQAAPAESGMLRHAPNIGPGRAPGKPPHAGKQPSFAEAKRQGVPERLPEAEDCAARKLAASRKRTPARPFCGQSVRAGGGTASGRASGMFRPPCSLAQTTRGSRRARRAGQADEPRFCTVAQRLRGQKACPQAEHGSKKGKEQQKGLSSPGQSRKRKALFMFMGKR